MTKHFSTSVPPSNSMVLCMLLLKLYKYMDAVRFGVSSAWRSQEPASTTIADIDCEFVKNALVFVYPKIGGDLGPP